MAEEIISLIKRVRIILIVGVRKIKSRQFEILLYLIEVKKTTYTKLAQRFEVSKKTIMRDIDKLSCMGIPVYAQPGYDGGIFIEPDYKFRNSFFTPKEVEDIILAFHIANHLNNDTEKSSVLKKLELLVPELTFLKEFDFDEYLKIDLIQSPIMTHTPICDIINAGLDEEVLLNITVDQEIYSVAPLYYILRSDGLYLHCANDECCFDFQIDKITECLKTNQEFERKNYQAEFLQK